MNNMTARLTGFALAVGSACLTLSILVDIGEVSPFDSAGAIAGDVFILILTLGFLAIAGAALFLPDEWWR